MREVTWARTEETRRRRTQQNLLRHTHLQDAIPVNVEIAKEEGAVDLKRQEEEQRKERERDESAGGSSVV